MLAEPRTPFARGRIRLPLARSEASSPGGSTPPSSVRLSLTDRCDLACVYCRPSRADGYVERRLDEDGWKTMVTALVRAGIRRFRLTGGEPLLHPGVLERVAFIASLGVDDLAMTTNGTRLSALARPLREAGLHRLTVSIDSLVPSRFFRMTRGGKLEQVRAGIDAALEAGFGEVKTNTVVLRGENEGELEGIVEWAWARGIVPRFIELMAIGEGARLGKERVYEARQMRADLAHLLVDEPGRPDPGRGPAKYSRSRTSQDLRVGFITGTTDTYCEGCDRLRVSATGTLRPCLATNDGVDAMSLAEAGDIDGVGSAVARAWALKPEGSTWKGCTEASAADVSIRAIGG